MDTKFSFYGIEGEIQVAWRLKRRLQCRTREPEVGVGERIATDKLANSITKLDSYKLVKLKMIYDFSWTVFYGSKKMLFFSKHLYVKLHPATQLDSSDDCPCQVIRKLRRIKAISLISKSYYERFTIPDYH